MSNEVKKEDTPAEVVSKLVKLDVNGHTETKKSGNTQLTYLSWAWAWAETIKLYPDAGYEIVKNPQGLPFFYDELTGYMVYTRVTIGGITREMWLPVMDGANKAMKAQPYTYKVKDYRSGGFIDKRVEAATMFDINKTVMRCLVKNLAMFGLGLYIYAGEDLPEGDDDADRDTEPKAKEPTPQKPPVKAKPKPVGEDPAREFGKGVWVEFKKRTTGVLKEEDRETMWKICLKNATGKTVSSGLTVDDWMKVKVEVQKISGCQSAEDCM